MRRALLPLLLLLLWPAAADAASVKVLACVPALDPVARSATFEARVTAAPGTDRMQVRFTLHCGGGVGEPAEDGTGVQLIGQVGQDNSLFRTEGRSRNGDRGPARCS